MNNQDTLRLSYHALVIGILLVLFIGFQWGYGRKERRIARQQKALYKKQQDIQPRASR